METQQDFQQAVNSVKSASQDFCNGDAESFKALWSHADNVTIMGGWGSFEHSWAQVGPRLDWAAARFIEGKGEFETIAEGADESVGYTIWIERYEARVQGSDTILPVALRVTHIYRREAGAWKIIHRHADPIMDKLPVAALVRQ